MREAIEFLVHYGYAVLGLTVLAEQLGVPVPSAPVLLAAGAVAGAGTLDLRVCIGIAFIAAFAGDLVWFTLGGRYGSAVLALLCRISLEPDSCVQRTETVYVKYGPWTLLFSKFIPGLSIVVTPLAGRFRLRAWRFVLFDGAGALLWTGTYMGVGWLFRSELERLADMLFRTGTSFGILVGFALGLYVVYRYFRRRHLYRELRLARIAPWELKERLERGENILLIDLRSPVEWDQGVIPGATRLSLGDLTSRAPGSLENSEVVLYCS